MDDQPYQLTYFHGNQAGGEPRYRCRPGWPRRIRTANVLQPIDMLLPACSLMCFLCIFPLLIPTFSMSHSFGMTFLTAVSVSGRHLLCSKHGSHLVHWLGHVGASTMIFHHDQDAPCCDNMRQSKVGLPKFTHACSYAWPVLFRMQWEACKFLLQ